MREGAPWDPLAGERLRCVACGHRCLIGEGRRGICKVRYVQQGEASRPWGYVAGLQSDPVEKKPFFHVLPGSDALTFGMLGCDLHCAYCFTGGCPFRLTHPGVRRTGCGRSSGAPALAPTGHAARTHVVRVVFSTLGGRRLRRTALTRPTGALRVAGTPRRPDGLTPPGAVYR